MTNQQQAATAKTADHSSADIAKWDVEDPVFWESQGKRIAYRNLCISVPALLCGFAVWGMWGIITEMCIRDSSTGASHVTVKEQLMTLKDPAVWRYSQYYSIVFGGYVGLSLWMTKYLSLIHISRAIRSTKF